ncbi:MAG TPA: tyrosine-protein phosphatase [Actinocrinis sp.]|uniref:tyrosine-protein phosphatase n=1 Tax=Actinocrinis sp. TaxID=1920516 RepID=UPI002DDD2200|nr:tyrosine-protein phosphatase [Actinocrinis sp.]HEV3168729.1 tyrosine-protein phosphatase [Actinocrinis sp.]
MTSGYPGLLNFRDVGGAPVSGGGRIRRGALYRSACPAKFPSGALAAQQLGLRTVVDLRDEAESAEWPYQLDDPAIVRVNVAVLGDRPVPPDQAGLYAHMAERCGAGFTAAVRAVARALPDPVLVHCAVGKDRTGFAVALALAAAGVPDEAIVADYVLSNDGLGLTEPVPGADADRAPDGAYLTGRYVDPALISGALASVRAQHGDAPGYLAAHGMAEDEIARLREELVELGARCGL